jgi:hypothetical protein
MIIAILHANSKAVVDEYLAAGLEKRLDNKSE